MNEPAWLSRELLDAMHLDQLQVHGGSPGIRDDGAVESALARPRNRWSHESSACDLADLAAAYGFALAKNHGYVDGNKRIAFVAMYVFLGLNAQELEAPEGEVVETMLAVAAGGMGEEELAAWLRAHLVRQR